MGKGGGGGVCGASTQSSSSHLFNFFFFSFGAAAICLTNQSSDPPSETSRQAESSVFKISSGRLKCLEFTETPQFFNDKSARKKEKRRLYFA